MSTWDPVQAYLCPSQQQSSRESRGIQCQEPRGSCLTRRGPARREVCLGDGLQRDASSPCWCFEPAQRHVPVASVAASPAESRCAFARYHATGPRGSWAAQAAGRASQQPRGKGPCLPAGHSAAPCQRGWQHERTLLRWVTLSACRERQIQAGHKDRQGRHASSESSAVWRWCFQRGFSLRNPWATRHTVQSSRGGFEFWHCLRAFIFLLYFSLFFFPLQNQRETFFCGKALC